MLQASQDQNIGNPHSKVNTQARSMAHGLEVDRIMFRIL